MIFLNTSETLARLGGAFSPGHRLLGLAAELAAGARASSSARAAAGAETAAAGTSADAALGEAAAAAGLAERILSKKGNAAACVAEFGALGAIDGARTTIDGAARAPTAPAATLLLWFSPSSEGGAACRQLVLDLPAGRYRAEYWGAAEGRLAGVEIATAAPLVLGLPDPRAAWAILVVSLF